MTNVLAGSQFDIQLDLEKDATTRAIERYQRLTAEANKRGDGANLKAGERLILYWWRALCKAITKEKRVSIEKLSRPGKPSPFRPYLDLLSTPRMALITMHVVIGRCLVEPAGTHTTKAALAIGRWISSELALDVIRKERGDAWDKVIHTDRKQLKPKNVQRIARKNNPDSVWPMQIQAMVGACLIKRLIEIAAIRDYGDKTDPAFLLFSRREGRKTPKCVRFTSEGYKVIAAGHVVRQSLRPRFMPMVVSPILWKEDSAGGYLQTPVPLVKRYALSVSKPPKDGIANVPSKHRRKRSTYGETEKVRQAVNCLNSTAWNVNKKTLAVVEQLWKDGGGLVGIPRADDLPKPPRPHDIDTNIESLKAWKKEAISIKRLNLQHMTDRVTFGYKLDVADRFKKFNRFYFPHQLDFRGRVYPLPLFLNTHGDDLCRGLLEFATSKPVTLAQENEWLYIHMATCCGIDKISIDDRLNWIADKESELLAWADDPLNNTGWMEADKPWQALAAAKALWHREAAARIPVQVDGSNNALQHYGAMLRCQHTAELVNLVSSGPSDTPADAYGEIAYMVEKVVSEETDTSPKFKRRNGEYYSPLEMAQKLDGWVKRKIVKQTVMTGPYSVTPVGARRQIATHLVDAGFKDAAVFHVSRYLSLQVLSAVDKLFPNACAAMAWLRKCAKMIVDSGRTIKWVTPMGFPVEQVYRKTTTFEVETMLHRMSINETGADFPINNHRQVNGFAPNWIHSLDACHLMMTAIEANKAGIEFAACHDGFWTHAASMTELSKILREQFVKLHAEPQLEVLAAQLSETYSDLDFPAPPPCGDFDLSQVLTSTYCFM